jgi:hypothetical protein
MGCVTFVITSPTNTTYPFSGLKIEIVCPFEMLISTYKTTGSDDADKKNIDKNGPNDRMLRFGCKELARDRRQ